MSTGPQETAAGSAPSNLSKQDFWLDRRVLVTGAAGFTGRHVVAELLNAGAQVTAVVRPNGSTATFDERVKLIAVDIRDPAACETLLNETTPETDTIFHVAAVFRTVGVSRKSLYESHVTATENLIRSGARNKLRRFLHVSTIGVQGPNPPDLATEDAPADPNDDYQTTKYEGELAAVSYTHLTLPTKA